MTAKSIYNHHCADQSVSLLAVVSCTNLRQVTLSLTAVTALASVISVIFWIPSVIHVVRLPLCLFSLTMPVSRSYSTPEACITCPKYLVSDGANHHQYFPTYTDLFFPVKLICSKQRKAHSSRASILLRSVFFIAHDSQPYKAVGKTSDCSRRIFVFFPIALFFQIEVRDTVALLAMAIRLLICKSHHVDC